MGDADEVEEFLFLLDELRRDLSPLSDSSLKRLETWAEILENIAGKYLWVDEEKDGSSKGVLEEILASLRFAEEKLDHAEFPFSCFTNLFNRKCMGQVGGALLHAIQFSSLEEGSVIPCRALFLIGQDEESFPRNLSGSSLDLLKGKKGAPPLAADRDRYLFLQAICSAQDLVAISYGHISPEEGKERGPSLLVQELLGYIRKSFHGELSTVTHPSFTLHPLCFNRSTSQTMSQKAYSAAQIFYGPKDSLNFWPPFDRLPTLAMPEGEITISLRDLNSLFRHPWKFYLQKVLHLSIHEKEKESWDEFEVDFLKRAQILRSSMKQPIETVIQKQEQNGSFPVGLFGEVARGEMIRIHEEWNENLVQFGFQGESLNAIFLRDNPVGPFEFPPLEIKWEQLKVKIVGEIRLCSRLGPLHLADDSLAALLKSWPEYLAALCTLKTDSIYCIRSGNVKTVRSPSDSLRRCLELYFLGLQTPLPLVNDWVDPLLRRGPLDLGKKIEESRSLFEDPVYDWVLARTEAPSGEAIFSTWSAFLNESLIDLINLYPTRSKKKEGNATI